MIKRFEGQSEDRGKSREREEKGWEGGSDRGANTARPEQTAIEKEELIKIQIP